MARVNVLSITHIRAAERERIEAVDPGVRLTDAAGWFDGEYRETWSAYAVSRYLAPNSMGKGTREGRDRLLAEAEVILGSWPFPLDLRARAPRLKWFHQRPAGASNLLRGDLWGSDVTVTTSRGLGNTLAMAEYAVAGILHFAKGLDRAAIDRAGAGVRSSRLSAALDRRQDRVRRRRRRDRARGRAAVRRARHAGGRYKAKSTAGRAACRRGSAGSAAPRISTFCCRRAISS